MPATWTEFFSNWHEKRREWTVDNAQLIIDNAYLTVFQTEEDFIIQNHHIMDNTVRNKSYAFALRIIKAYRFLSTEQKEFVLSKQLLRSGTSIGANIRESEHAQSKADFIHKLSVALKEANETEYWLDLLYETRYVSESEFQSIKPKVIEILKILVSIINTSKGK